MRLFWRHGYEGVSINDLTSAIGIAPPSLYAAFGSKAALYREALDRYSGLRGVPTGPATAEPLAETLEGTIELLLRRAVDAVTDPSGERGCMISTGMIECASELAGLASELAARRRRMRDHIADALTRWLDEAAAGALARYVIVVVQGLAVQVRDGATRDELHQVVDQAVAGLRTTTPGRGPRGAGPAPGVRRPKATGKPTSPRARATAAAGRARGRRLRG